MPITSVAGHFIYQAITDVGLIDFKTRIRDCEDYLVILGSCGHV